MLGEHAQMKGYAIEAGCLGEGGECAGQTRECDELVAAEGSHWMDGESEL